MAGWCLRGGNMKRTIIPCFTLVALLGSLSLLQAQSIITDVPLTKKDTDNIRTILGRKEIRGEVYDSQHDILLFKIGYTTNIYSGIDIGFLLNKQLKERGPAMSLSKRGPAIGSEFIFKSSDLLIAPKLSYDIYFWALLALRQNLIYYTDLKGASAFRYRVDLGLSLVGYFNLLYGFNINLTEHQFTYFNHIFTISAALSLLSKRMKIYKDHGDKPTYVLEYPYSGSLKKKHRWIARD
jgi:hypothetical protein